MSICPSISTMYCCFTMALLQQALCLTWERQIPPCCCLAPEDLILSLDFLSQISKPFCFSSQIIFHLSNTDFFFYNHPVASHYCLSSVTSNFITYPQHGVCTCSQPLQLLFQLKYLHFKCQYYLIVIIKTVCNLSTNLSVILHVKTFLISTHLSTSSYLLYLLISFYRPLFLVEIAALLF